MFTEISMTATTCSPIILPTRSPGDGAAPASGWHVRLRAWVVRRLQVRALAEVMEMDEHMLDDIGAPPWIKLEAAAHQARERRGFTRTW
ncbi:hypothetical protein BBB44_08750 [Bordetella bronchiseptica]|nr:hypothetical protein BBB44_08750 [Bordetella bronchiseptica]AZW43622.1 hypothetical protein CWR61_08840 [Bordetella bronchiseptica]